MAAPSFRDELVELYRPQGVVFFGIEKNTTGDVSLVRNFCFQFGWDFPVGRNNRTTLDPFRSYSTDRDNYFVIGRDGVILFRAVSGSAYTGTGWTSQRDQIFSKVAEALAVPVAPTTWSRVKSLYR